MLKQKHQLSDSKTVLNGLLEEVKFVVNKELLELLDYVPQGRFLSLEKSIGDKLSGIQHQLTLNEARIVKMLDEYITVQQHRTQTDLLKEEVTVKLQEYTRQSAFDELKRQTNFLATHKQLVEVADDLKKYQHHQQVLLSQSES